MPIDRDRLERAAVAAMQALLESRSGSSPADISEKSVEYALALLQRVDAASTPSRP
jgi:hypothetical protein